MIFKITRSNKLLKHVSMGLLLFWYSSPKLILNLFKAEINAQSLPLNGNQALYLVRYSIYFAIILLAIFTWRPIIKAVWDERWIAALILLALVSAYWSPIPRTTLYHAGSLLIATLVGYYFAASFSIREQVLILGATFSVIVLLNLFAVILFPEYSIHIRLLEGAWRGIHGHKSYLGILMALSSATFWILSKDLTLCEYRRLFAVGFGLSILILVFSDARWSIVVYFVATVVVIMLMRHDGNIPTEPQLRQQFLQIVLLACIFGATILTRPSYSLTRIFTESDLHPRLDHVGTLTGRTFIWQQLPEKIKSHPILGYGYNSFWTENSMSPSKDVTYPSGGHAPSAHNGYLEFALDFGIVGVLLFGFQFFVTLSRAFHIKYSEHSIICFWPLLILLILAGVNLMESSFMEINLQWILYSSASTSLSLFGKYNAKTHNL